MSNPDKITDDGSGSLNNYSSVPLTNMARLPYAIRTSTILSVENISKLSSVKEIPAIDPAFEDETLKNIFQYFSVNPEEMEREIHLYANNLLDQNKLSEAWQVLLAVN